MQGTGISLVACKIYKLWYNKYHLLTTHRALAPATLPGLDFFLFFCCVSVLVEIVERDDFLILTYLAIASLPAVVDKTFGGGIIGRVDSFDDDNVLLVDLDRSDF